MFKLENDIKILEKPTSKVAVGGKYLLIFTDFAFLVDKDGARVNDDWLIEWIGSPISFNVTSSHVIAFDVSLVEVWSLENASLQQVIPMNNLRYLHTEDQMDAVVDSTCGNFQEIVRLESIN